MNRKMKDSGIEWLGKIPDNWDIVKIKYLQDPNQKDSFVDGDWIESPYITNKGIRYLTSGNIGDGVFKRQGDGYISYETFEKLGCKYAYPNDLIISRLNSPFGRACILPNDEEKYVLAVDNVILRTKHNIRFLCYVMQCDGYHMTIEENSAGTAMRRISRSNLGDIKLPIAPLEEQNMIADFLDSKCEAIDQTIQKQKEIIDKLTEYRQATITQVVTHGVNSDNAIRRLLKNDYIWFDEIPQNWKTYKLKYITKLSKEKAISKENYIGLENVESKTGKFIGSQVEPDGDAIIFHQNDVLFGKLRPYLSKSLLVEQEGCCSGEFLVITPKQIIPKYLLYITLSKTFVEHVNSSTYGAKMPRSNWEFVRNMMIPLPTESEQKEIISYLDKKLASIDNVIESTNTIIQKLEEYKKSLIYNAVTGKIDCRGEVK